MKTTRRKFLQVSGAAAGVPLLAVLFKSKKEPNALCQQLASDPLRPQYHLLPASNWMNDPNGPIYFRGRYHMFHQYNPKGAVWGNMNWAHASSSDMVHWRQEPIAISPSPGGYDRDGVFSGSAVLDAGMPTVIYTGVMPPATDAEATLRDGVHTWREVQCLAVSRDPDLRTWEKLPDPVIASPPEGMDVTGFRDPFLWREGDAWLLALGSGIKNKGGMVLLYQSTDLRHWTYLHPLLEGSGNQKNIVNPVDKGEMWECPDFFALGGKHVLLISTEGKVLWKVGTYRDRRFTSEKEGVVDWGAYYAAKTMVDEGGNRILWGWIPEKRPEAEHNAAGWAGAMSLPRVLSLNVAGELRMDILPEVQKLRHAHWIFPVDETLETRKRALESFRIPDLSCEVSAVFRLKEGETFKLLLHSEDGENFATIACSATGSGAVFSVNDVTASLLKPKDGRYQLSLFLDGSVLEVFLNGTTALTARVYVIPKWPLQLGFAGDVTLESAEAWQIQPISRDRLTASLCG